MFHEQLARELVRRLRGRRSQRAFSRRLKYSSNVVYLWESGRRYPDAEAFLALAELANPGVFERLLPFMGDVATRRMTPPSGARQPHAARPPVAALLASWTEGLPLQAIARLAGTHRVTAANWLAGRTCPRLPEFLRIVEGTTHRLLEFVELFVDPATLRTTRRVYADFLAQRRLAYELPWSHAVLHALEVHPDSEAPAAAIAATIGLQVDEVEGHLRALSAAKVLHRRGRKYRKTRALTVDTQGDPELNFRLKRHWAAVGNDRLERTRARQTGLFSYNVFPLSKADLERLRQLHADYYNQVRKLVAGARGADEVVVLNLQLFPLSENGPTPAALLPDP